MEGFQKLFRILHCLKCKTVVFFLCVLAKCCTLLEHVCPAIQGWTASCVDLPVLVQLKCSPDAVAWARNRNRYLGPSACFHRFLGHCLYTAIFNC